MDANFSSDIAAIARIDSVPKILEMVCRTTGLGFSAVARVTETRWVTCAVRDEISFGLMPGGELDVATTICDQIRRSGEAVVIEHVAEDQLYCGHHTPLKYGFQSYASFPIYLPDGSFFGTLCAIDPRPARLNTPEIMAMFKLFAELIGLQLQAQKEMAASAAALLDEKQASQLREQFIAVLGHDLRNPLNAISSSAELLRTLPLAEEDVEIVDIIHRGAGRMAGLIDNLTDFARGRLGGGLVIAPTLNAKLGESLNHVLDELQSAWPRRKIDRDFNISRTFACDTPRIAQMLSNLVANAITHGDPASPVWVHADTGPDYFELSVTNQGPSISPETMQRLFQPFVRGAVRHGQQGLGLGLYIASEIAKAHEGVLTVNSQSGKICFTLRMPIPPVPYG